MLQTTMHRQTNKISLMPSQSTQNCWKIAYPAAKYYGQNESVLQSQNFYITQRKWLINFKNVGIIGYELNNKLIKLACRRYINFEKKKWKTLIQLSLKCNRTLPKIKEIVMKHWHLLDINPNLGKHFQNSLILAFHQNKSQRRYWYQINCKWQSQKEIYEQNTRQIYTTLSQQQNAVL